MIGQARGRPPAVDRRAQILGAAREVLLEHGYSGATVREIAARAGIAPGLLSYYYPAKDALLVDVVAALDEEMTSRWLAAMDGVEDPLARVTAGFDAAVEQCLARPDFFRLVFDLLVVGADDAAVRARSRELLDHIVSLIGSEVERVTAELGTPPASLDGADLPAAIAAAFDGVFLHAVVRDADPRPSFAALRAMLLALASTYGPGS